MKKFVMTLVIILAVFVGLNLFKNGIIQTALASAISRAAHVPVSIGSTNARIFASFIDLRNIRIYNPKGFPEKLMLDIPQILVDFDLAPVFKGRSHFEEVRLNVKEVIVIKNRNGVMNVDAMKPSQEETQKAKEKKAEAKKKTDQKPPKIMIDKLYLTVGRVVYKDYSAGGEPAVQVFDIQIQDRLYTHIDNPAAIASLIMFEALTRTTLSRLASLDTSSFEERATGAFAEGLGLTREGAGQLEETAKGLLSFLK